MFKRLNFYQAQRGLRLKTQFLQLLKVLVAVVVEQAETLDILWPEVAEVQADMHSVFCQCCQIQVIQFKWGKVVSVGLVETVRQVKLRRSLVQVFIFGGLAAFRALEPLMFRDCHALVTL
jgi:hypothetical protein